MEGKQMESNFSKEDSDMTKEEKEKLTSFLQSLYCSNSDLILAQSNNVSKEELNGLYEEITVNEKQIDLIKNFLTEKVPRLRVLNNPVVDELSVKAVKLLHHYISENRSMAEARDEQVKAFMETQNDRTKYYIEEGQPIQDTFKELDKRASRN